MRASPASYFGEQALNAIENVVVGLGLAAIVGGAGVSQEPSNEGIPHVTLEVAGDADHTIQHTITISAEGPRPVRTERDLERLGWTAIRVSERGTDRITSNDCPALRQVALGFRDLPVIQNDTWATRIFSDTSTIMPTMKDGFSTQIRFVSAAVSVEAAGGPYGKWGHDVVSALLPCWQPLIPANSSRYWERNTPEDE